MVVTGGPCLGGLLDHPVGSAPLPEASSPGASRSNPTAPWAAPQTQATCTSCPASRDRNAAGAPAPTPRRRSPLPKELPTPKDNAKSKDAQSVSDSPAHLPLCAAWPTVSRPDWIVYTPASCIETGTDAETGKRRVNIAHGCSRGKPTFGYLTAGGAPEQTLRVFKINYWYLSRRAHNIEEEFCSDLAKKALTRATQRDGRVKVLG